MNKKIILITGTNGYMGGNFLHTFKARYPEADVYGINKSIKVSTSHIFAIDLLDKKIVSEVIAKVQPDYTFHFAGAIKGEWTELCKANVHTTINLLEAIQHNKPSSRVFLVGSAAEYGVELENVLPVKEEQVLNPASPYGFSKVWQTNVAGYFASRGLDIVLGRVFNVLGRGMSDSLAIGSFASQLRKIRLGEMPPRIQVGNLKSKRDYLDINDVSAAFIDLALHGRKGEPYNICSGFSISMEQILDLMVKQINTEVEIQVDKEKIKNVDVTDIYGSREKISLQTGWTPKTSIEQSIQYIMKL